MSDNEPSLRRITFVTHEFHPKIGGAATVVVEMAKAAVTLGWEVQVLAPGRADPEDRNFPFEVERMGHRGRQDWLARIALLRYLRNRGNSSNERLVIAEPGALRALLYAPFFGVSFHNAPGIILHGTEILRFSSPLHRKLLLKRLLGQSHFIQVLSGFNRDLLQSRIPNLKTNVTLAPGAPSFSPPPANTGKSQPPEADKKITILTVGRIHPRKGQLDTLEALSQLPTVDQQRIRYRIIGPSVRPGYRKRILKLASRCPFPVELPGALSEEALLNEYATADIFALTSRQTKNSVEGFGLVYLDASAHGLPVVATRSGGIPEAVVDGETGLLAAEGDIGEIAHCLQNLIRESSLRRKMSLKGREHASRHNWIEAASTLLGEPST